MLLNNLSVYQDILKKSRHEIVQREDKRYEVERLYSTSPIIFDYSETYLPDGMYMVEETEPRKSIIFDNQDDKSESSEDDTNEEKKKAFPKASVLTFRRVPVKRKKEDEPPPISVLSRMIEECISLDDDNDADKDSGGVPLTIYLPDYNSIMVNVKETSNFKEVIQQVLVSHEKQGVEPPLDYRDPGMYELRIHEGDGEPDRDFPALGPDKLMSDFNLDEYCICVVEGRRRAATGPGTSSIARPAGNTAVTDNSISTFTPPLPHLMPSSVAGSGMPRSNSGGLLATASSYAQSALNSYTGRQRDDTADTLGVIRGRTRTSSKMSYDSFQTHTVSTLMVLFPDGTQVVAPFSAETRLLDLLPPISKVKRLRLYTNEYVFCVSPADQKRLKLMSPFLDMQQLVITIGATSLEIHNRVYQDVGKMEKSAAAAAAKKKKTTKKKSNFTEAMANAYQEWNVVKKNKFGRKQERVFGVDGKKIYNSKRGQLRGGNQTGVQRAERNISTIVKLDILPNDTKTFRITWMDDRDVYNIEYTCETQRECAEIVAKINYTREKYK